MAKIDSKIIKKIEKAGYKKIKKNAKAKAVPFMKSIIRKKTGALRKTVRAEIIEDAKGMRVSIIAGDENVTYAQQLETTVGLFDDGTTLGQRYDEIAKLIND